MSAGRRRLVSIGVIVLLVECLAVFALPAQGLILEGQSADFTPAQQTDSSGVVLELRPQEAAIGIDGSLTYAIAVSNVSGGVGAYNMSLSLSDGSAADITAVNLRGSPGLSTITYGKDNDSVRIEAALADTADSGQVTIANVTVRGISNGVAAVDLSIISIADESGAVYRVESVHDARLTVGNPTTRAGTTTTAPSTHTISTTPTATPSSTVSTSTNTATSGTSGPGFSIAVAVIAFFLAALLAATKNH